jgi:hypothetical protein
MLDSAVVVITRNIEAVLPSTMNYALVIIFADDDPMLVHSGNINTAMVVNELRAAADIARPPAASFGPPTTYGVRREVFEKPALKKDKK